MKSHALEAYGDPDTRRILRNGKIVAFALRLSNGKWGVYDLNETRLTGRTFSSPNGALKWFAMVGDEMVKE